jgi:hypothetical protein
MRSRPVLVALTLAGLALLGAAGAATQWRKHKTEAAYLLARGNAEAQTYATTFEGKAADDELSTFDQRRDTLERAYFWQRLAIILVFVALLSAMVGYFFYLMRRLTEGLNEAAEPLADKK